MGAHALWAPALDRREVHQAFACDADRRSGGPRDPWSVRVKHLSGSRGPDETCGGGPAPCVRLTLLHCGCVPMRVHSNAGASLASHSIAYRARANARNISPGSAHSGVSAGQGHCREACLSQPPSMRILVGAGWGRACPRLCVSESVRGCRSGAVLVRHAAETMRSRFPCRRQHWSARVRVSTHPCQHGRGSMHTQAIAYPGNETRS